MAAAGPAGTSEPSSKQQRPTIKQPNMAALTKMVEDISVKVNNAFSITSLAYAVSVRFYRISCVCFTEQTLARSTAKTFRRSKEAEGLEEEAHGHPPAASQDRFRRLEESRENAAGKACEETRN